MPRKEQHHAEIGFGHLIGLRFGTEQRRNRIHKKDAEQRKAEARKQTAGRSRRINLPRSLLISDRAGHDKTSRTADTEHKSDAVDKIINRNRKIQRSQTVCAESPRDKISVRQNINRLSHHGEHTG